MYCIVEFKIQSLSRAPPRDPHVLYRWLSFSVYPAFNPLNLIRGRKTVASKFGGPFGFSPSRSIIMSDDDKWISTLTLWRILLQTFCWVLQKTYRKFLSLNFSLFLQRGWKLNKVQLLETKYLRSVVLWAFIFQVSSLSNLARTYEVLGSLQCSAWASAVGAWEPLEASSALHECQWHVVERPLLWILNFHAWVNLLWLLGKYCKCQK